ncbi:MAG: hypothetical protein PHI72_04425 [Atribacterota bacterium]|nr:hypothetical protein [Atribacterota bacterium]MDD4895687.1 hypothetical protein [Atribacterota bacterium]MDD5638153.1 hypothetical protein [Atribacterota bacterium]
MSYGRNLASGFILCQPSSLFPLKDIIFPVAITDYTAYCSWQSMHCMVFGL